MVRAKLRAMERKLVLERAEVCLEGMVNNLVIQWNAAMQMDWPLTDPMDFIQDVIGRGFFTRGNVKALNYLEECKGKRELPDQRRLIQIFLPWYR